MNSYSLRERTQRALVMPLLLALAGIVLLGGGFAWRMASEQMDEQMLQNARLLQLLARHEAAERDSLGDVEAGLPMFPRQLPSARAEYRIWTDSGILAETHAMPWLQVRPGPGFQDIVIDGRSWRLFVLVRDKPAIRVELAEPMQMRLSFMAGLMVSLAVPGALLVLSMFFIGRRGIARALRPLEDLSAAIDRRNADDLTLVDVPALPTEVAPMVTALNRLLARVGSALGREREFSDNAAHELRTPLAALKTRAQLIQRKLADSPELADDMRDFARSVDRTANVIDRLLELTRVTSPEAAVVPLDLSAAAIDCIAALVPLATEKNMAVTADIAPAVIVTGNAMALELAMRNLIGNAIKFAPAGGEVTVRLATTVDRARFSVSDDGPGIAAGDEERIFERFQRGRGEGAGTGLGLTLVRAVAVGHGGRALACRLEPHGLEVTLEIPSEATNWAD